MRRPPVERTPAMTPFLARRERFDRVGSTNDVVRDWLAEGTPEACLAVAREQTAGRGREDRRWVAPAGAALLLSLGFRPTWLAPDLAWRLAALVSLAMADAAETVAGLPSGTVRLKWPNDLVIDDGAAGDVRKVAGVLGETAGLGTDDPRVVVGIGVNADWPVSDFPPHLAGSMTSLREAAGLRAIDVDVLLEAFIGRLEPRVEALRAGRFDGAGWADRQLTTGRAIRLETAGGDRDARALGVDTATGALILADASTATGEFHVVAGEITHVRLAEPAPGRV
jgi:BirA family biotin operon repressor/biotin-[acetyl-CoA-carboxylase] ligase